jgi:hypothetical protein
MEKHAGPKINNFNTNFTFLFDKYILWFDIGMNYS